MIPVTANELEELLQKYKDASVPDEQLRGLRDQIDRLKSGRLEYQTEPGVRYKEIERDGKRIVCVSSAPMTPDEEEFDLADFKPVKPRPSRLTARSFLAKLGDKIEKKLAALLS